MPIPRILNHPNAHELFEEYRAAREREARYVGVALALPLPVAKRLLLLRYLSERGKVGGERG